jgi:hypothetical protein
MARSNSRYLWGRTMAEKVIIKKWIDFDVQASSPDVSQGRMYVDSNGAVKFCADGTSFSTVTVS